MPIVFSVVACERNIVAKFASCDGNFMEIAEQLLSKLPTCNNKMTYSHGIYLLHYIAEDDNLYFCITDKLCQRSRAFLFLNEIQRRYIARKARDNFTEVLAAEMYRYSEDYSTITVRKGELDELNSIGVGCSESILGEKILLINNPDNISYIVTSHVSAIPERISVMANTTEAISYASATPDKISTVNPTLASPTLEEISFENQITDRVPALSRNEDSETLENSSKSSVKISSSNAEIKALENLTSEKLSDPVPSPRLYVVIIGMIILVIGMAVYAFGPVSCAVITSIGIYSILRSYVNSKVKSEKD